MIPWTALCQKMFPALRLHELPPGECLMSRDADAWRNVPFHEKVACGLMMMLMILLMMRRMMCLQLYESDRLDS